mgnify:CR=1 FL=1
MKEVNEKISEEAKIAYESAEANNYYNPESDVLLHFWTYVISKSKLENIFAESRFLQLFDNIGYVYGEASYIAITFVSAIESIRRDMEDLKKDFQSTFTQNITPAIINTTKIESYGKKYPDRGASKKGK